MTRIGLELNASAVRGVSGPTGDYPQPLPLEPPGHDLPMVILLERSTPELGRPAVNVAREKGHMICRDFLSRLGESGPKATRWRIGRHNLDAEAALGIVFERLKPIGKTARQLTIALPSYIGSPQAEIVRARALKAKLPLTATLSATLAAALVGYAEQAWVTSAVVIDVDDHALTLGLVRAVEGQAQLLQTRSLPLLSLRAWRERLLNGLSDACVWQTRRDPRDTPAAEQRLFDQLDGLFDAALQGRMVQIGVQGSNWYQNLLVGPVQANHFCGNLLLSLQGEIERLQAGSFGDNDRPVYLLTHAAGRLPGVVALCRRLQEAQTPAPQPRALAPRKTALADEDFGEFLLDQTGQASSGVVILSADALSRAAHGFDQDWTGHCEDEAPLPLPFPVDAGPARVVHEGQNHYLTAGSFVLGTQPGCQLLFDTGRHSQVAGRHCDIAADKRGFVLTNRSREGTYVNDSVVHHSAILQAGDWIRLGAAGPTVRFLGQLAPRGRATTA